MKAICKHVTYDEIIDLISFEKMNKLPNFIISIATIRSGTNASLRLFSESGILAYSQPIKSIFRHLVQNKDKKQCHWIIPDCDFIYVKETLGPFNYEESSINIVDVMLLIFKKYLDQKGINDITPISLLQEKVQFLFMARWPYDSIYSNIKTYRQFIKKVNNNDHWYYELSEVELVKNHITAYKELDNIKKVLVALDVKYTVYIMEANITPEYSLSKLFLRLGLKKLVYDNWDKKTSLNEKGSRVITTIDHENQYRANLLDYVNMSVGISYRSGDGEKLNEEFKRLIKNSGALSLYKDWVHESQNQLKIKIKIDHLTGYF